LKQDDDIDDGKDDDDSCVSWKMIGIESIIAALPAQHTAVSEQFPSSFRAVAAWASRLSCQSTD